MRVLEIAVHPRTQKQIELFIQKPVNSLLLVGADGSGKVRLASGMTEELLKLDNRHKFSNYPYIFHAKKTDSKQDISIDTVRQIIRFLKLKTPGAGIIKRVILIENAQYLSQEAQNALLKILEEPNDDSIFILTAPYVLSLLPTIVSRCQQIHVFPVTIQQAADFYRSRYSTSKLQSAWQLSQGQPALLDALLKNDNTHPLKQAIENAKTFLRMSKYQRLLFLATLDSDREALRLFLEALSKILAALHYSSLQSVVQRPASNLLSSRQFIKKAQSLLAKNANLKLISLGLVLNLRV